VDEHFVINGRKCFITRGAVADFFVVTLKVVTEGREPNPSFMIVERGAPGFMIGKVEKTLGLRGNPSTELIFEDCLVPKESLLREGDMKNILTGLNIARCGNATVSLGLAQGAFEEALKYSQQRIQFGRALSSIQAIRWMLAEMLIKITAARLLIYNAAVNAAKGFPKAIEASIAKTFSNEMAIEVTNTALQIHGAYGYSCEFPLERMMRDARAFSIAGGTVQIQRNIVASQLLKQAESAGVSSMQS
jgi:alkylation response protein AidB-like acyl-CoA dehydrogenase